MNKTTVAKSILIANLTASCGTSQKEADLSLVFYDSYFLGNSWRVTLFQSSSINRKVLSIIKHHNFFSEIKLYQTKPHQTSLTLDDNVISSSSLNRQVFNATEQSTVTLQIITPIEDEMNEYLIQLRFIQN